MLLLRCVRCNVPAEDALSLFRPGNPDESEWRNHPSRRVVRRILFTTAHSRKINPLMLFEVKGDKSEYSVIQGRQKLLHLTCFTISYIIIFINLIN